MTSFSGCEGSQGKRKEKKEKKRKKRKKAGARTHGVMSSVVMAMFSPAFHSRAGDPLCWDCLHAAPQLHVNMALARWLIPADGTLFSSGKSAAEEEGEVSAWRARAPARRGTPVTQILSKWLSRAVARLLRALAPHARAGGGDGAGIGDDVVCWPGGLLHGEIKVRSFIFVLFYLFYLFWGRCSSWWYKGSGAEVQDHRTNLKTVHLLCPDVARSFLRSFTSKYVFLFVILSFCWYAWKAKNENMYKYPMREHLDVDRSRRRRSAFSVAVKRRCSFRRRGERFYGWPSCWNHHGREDEACMSSCPYVAFHSFPSVWKRDAFALCPLPLLSHYYALWHYYSCFCLVMMAFTLLWRDIVIIIMYFIAITFLYKYLLLHLDIFCVVVVVVHCCTFPFFHTHTFLLAFVRSLHCPRWCKTVTFTWSTLCVGCYIRRWFLHLRSFLHTAPHLFLPPRLRSTTILYSCPLRWLLISAVPITLPRCTFVVVLRLRSSFHIPIRTCLCPTYIFSYVHASATHCPIPALHSILHPITLFHLLLRSFFPVCSFTFMPLFYRCWLRWIPVCWCRSTHVLFCIYQFVFAFLSFLHIALPRYIPLRFIFTAILVARLILPHSVFLHPVGSLPTFVPHSVRWLRYLRVCSCVRFYYLQRFHLRSSFLLGSLPFLRRYITLFVALPFPAFVRSTLRCTLFILFLPPDLLLVGFTLRLFTLIPLHFTTLHYISFYYILLHSICSLRWSIFTRSLTLFVTCNALLLLLYTLLRLFYVTHPSFPLISHSFTYVVRFYRFYVPTFGWFILPCTSRSHSHCSFYSAFIHLLLYFILPSFRSHLRSSIAVFPIPTFLFPYLLLLMWFRSLLISYTYRLFPPVHCGTTTFHSNFVVDVVVVTYCWRVTNVLPFLLYFTFTYV